MSVDSVFDRTPRVRKPGWRKALPWLALIVAVAALIAVLLVKYRNTGHSDAAPLTNKPAVDLSKVPSTVKLAPGAMLVARRFIRTAVARKNLDRAYSIVTEQVRQGQSLREWRTGNIAV